MNLKLYSIYDSKAKEFGPLFEAKNDEVAIRKCKMEFKGVFGLDDFQLLFFGEFDHDCGKLTEYAGTLLVCNLADLFDEEKKDK